MNVALDHVPESIQRQIAEVLAGEGILQLDAQFIQGQRGIGYKHRQRGSEPVAFRPMYERKQQRRWVASVARIRAVGVTHDVSQFGVIESRRQGADPAKLARQISLFGKSAMGCRHRGCMKALTES